MTTVFVGNIAYETTSAALEEHMKTAGVVVSAEVKERRNGRSAGFGIVAYADAGGAQNAISSLTESELDGRKIFVREDNGGKTPGEGATGGGRAPRSAPKAVTDGKTVFVGNLSYDTTSASLEECMKRAGVVVSAEVKERRDGKSAGFGIVEFADQATAQNAIASLTDYELDGRSIFVREDNGGGGDGGGRGRRRKPRGEGGENGDGLPGLPSLGTGF